MLLVDLQPEVLLEQRRQAKRGQPEQLRRDSGVEDVVDVPAVVLMQQPEVVVGVVEDDLDPGVLEQRTKLHGRADRQRIDDRTASVRRQLEQVDAVDEPVKARPFGVERNRFRAGDGRQKDVHIIGGVEIVEGMRRGACHAGQSSAARRTPPTRVARAADRIHFGVCRCPPYRRPPTPGAPPRSPCRS